jgi:hypothetical protein
LQLTAVSLPFVLFQINSIPINYLLDPAGKIVGIDLHGPALEEMLHTIIVSK